MLLLQILLGILKIAGILLLAVLLLLVCLLLAVLLVPLRYRVSVVYTEEEKGAEAVVTWLLHLVSVRFSLDLKQGEKTLQLRLFGCDPSKTVKWFRGLKGRKPGTKRRKKPHSDAAYHSSGQEASGGQKASVGQEEPVGQESSVSQEEPVGQESSAGQEEPSVIQSGQAKVSGLSEGPEKEANQSGEASAEHVFRDTAGFQKEEKFQNTGAGNGESSGERDSPDDADEIFRDGGETEKGQSFRDGGETGEQSSRDGGETEKEQSSRDGGETEKEQSSRDGGETEKAQSFRGRRPAEIFRKLQNKIQGFCNKIRALPDRAARLWRKIKLLREKLAAILQKPEEFFHKADAFWQLLQEYEAFETLRTVWSEGKKLLRHYRPRKGAGYLRFGTGDPARTGELTGLLYCILPISCGEVEILPEFYETAFEVRLKLCGHIRAGHLAVSAVRLFFDRRLRNLIGALRTQYR